MNNYLLESCSNYRAIAGSNTSLWRGFGSSKFHGVNILPPIVNRYPRNTPKWIHSCADDWFLKNFGVRYRSEALFCTGDKKMASYYGNIYPIVPFDGFKFCWSSTIEDFYRTVSMANLTEGDNSSVIELLEYANYTEKDLPSAIVSRCEIMLHATNYLLLAD